MITKDEKERIESLNSDVYKNKTIRRKYEGISKRNSADVVINKKNSGNRNVKKAVFGGAMIGILMVSGVGAIMDLGTREIVNNVVASGCIDEDVYSMDYSDGISVFRKGDYLPVVDTDSYLREKAEDIMDKNFSADEAYIALKSLYGADTYIDKTNVSSRSKTKFVTGIKYIDEFLDYLKNFEKNRKGR